MPLAELALENLRCIERAELVPAPGINLIFGPNASGKTSLLEGIYLLGRGRSFRTRNSERLIRHGQDTLQALGRTLEAVSQRLRVEVTRDETTRAEIAGVAVGSLAQLAQAFPVQIIEPGVHRLIEEGSPRRRRWLDWAVRTASDTARAWDGELVRHGEALNAARLRLLGSLKAHWDETVRQLADLPAELVYSTGWKQGLSLEESLTDSWERDRSRGLSHSGPHRADVQIRIDGRAAREVLSRGQQKLVATAMIVAQLKLLRELTAVVPTLLLDDPAAELDAGKLARFVEQVKSLHCQLILTSLDAKREPFGPPERTFHVEQGRVQPV